MAIGPWLAGWDLLGAQAAVLLVGFAAASVMDLRRREVGDELWVVMTLVGGAVLLLGTSWSDPWAVGFDILLTLFVLEHLLPWDEAWVDHPMRVLAVEGSMYAGVVALLVLGLWTGRIEPAIVAAILAIFFARGLFEAGLIYGGADAKALMVCAVVLPVLQPGPIAVGLPASFAASTGSLPSFIPFAFTVLVDGAALTLGVPIAFFLWNLKRGDRAYAKMFTTYEIPTEDLPKKFVWLREPPPEPHEREETTDEDEEIRKSQATALLARGVTRVRVTPQLPFLVALAGGAVLGLLVGNIFFWVLALLP